MKTLFFFLVTSALSISLCFAGFKVPRSIFTINEIEKAKLKAVEKQEPLIILLSNPNRR